MPESFRPTTVVIASSSQFLARCRDELRLELDSGYHRILAEISPELAASVAAAFDAERKAGVDVSGRSYRGLVRRKWADNAPTGAASGRTP